MLINYLKLSLKVLARRKFFTFISLFGISLTLVVLMLGATVLDNLFSPRAPESRFDRVLCVYSIAAEGKDAMRTGEPGYKFLDRYVRGLPGAVEMSSFSQFHPTAMYREGKKIETLLKHTDGSYWRILNFDFLEGGPFTSADDARGSLVAVISAGLRARLFGGGPAVGKSFEVDGQRFRVVGVVADVPILRFAAFSEIWVPIGTLKTSDYRRQFFGDFNGIVLARSRSDFPAMRAEFARRMQTVTFDNPKMFHTIHAGLDTPFETMARLMFSRDSSRAAMLRGILLLGALLFITLPTLNLVTVNLSRILERSSEIGVRKAFGASSRTLVGQFVVENVVLTLIGGLVGFVLTVACVAALNGSGVIPHVRYDVNVRIFLYAMLLAGAFGIVSGVVPAWRMSRLHPVNALRGGAL